MTDELFRIVLDLAMCADPSPLTAEDELTLTNELNKESQARGFENWTIAFHEFTPCVAGLGEP